MILSSSELVNFKGGSTIQGSHGLQEKCNIHVIITILGGAQCKSIYYCVNRKLILVQQKLQPTLSVLARYGYMHVPIRCQYTPTVATLVFGFGFQLRAITLSEFHFACVTVSESLGDGARTDGMKVRACLIGNSCHGEI